METVDRPHCACGREACKVAVNPPALTFNVVRVCMWPAAINDDWSRVFATSRGHVAALLTVPAILQNTKKTRCRQNNHKRQATHKTSHKYAHAYKLHISQTGRLLLYAQASSLLFASHLPSCRCLFSYFRLIISHLCPTWLRPIWSVANINVWEGLHK